MTTQYKWLPEQPTNEMLDAVFALEEPNTLREYQAMWQAAPDKSEQEPVGYAGAESIAYLVEGGDSGILVVPAPTDTRDTPLYTHPPKREPLDDETILGIARTIPNLSGDDSALIHFARELGV